MGENTIKFYRELKTDKLQNLLKSLETAQYNIEEHLIHNSNSKLEKQITDYDIDINLIRMELNKRLWVDDF